MAAGRKRPKWLKRIALGSTLALAALVVAVLVFVNTAAFREQLRVRVNTALAPLFQGKLQIERVGAVGLAGIGGVDARVFDAQGRQVLRVQGLRVKAALPSIAWQFLRNPDHPQIRLDTVAIDHADVTLRPDEATAVTLGSAFLPREVSSTPSKPGTGPELLFPDLLCHHVWAHGSVTGSPPLDAELRELHAGLRQSPSAGLDLRVTRTDVKARALPGDLDVDGHFDGSLALAPGAAPPRLIGTFRGRAAGADLACDADWQGDELAAQLNVTGLPADVLNRRAGLQLAGDVDVNATVAGPLPILSLRAVASTSAGDVDAIGYLSVDEPRELFVRVSASGVDLSRAVASAPPSRLSLRAGGFAFADRLATSIEVGWDEGRASGQLAVPRGHATLRAQLGLAAPHPLSAEALVEVPRADVGAVHAAHIKLRAQATGSVERPRVVTHASFDALDGRVRSSVALHLERPSATAPLRLNGTASVDLGQVGSVALRAVDFELPSSGEPPRGGPGQLEVKSDLRLEYLTQLLKSSELPLEYATGRVHFEASTKLVPGAASGPEIAAALDTYGLRIVGRRAHSGVIKTTAEARENDPTALEGFDFHLSVHAQLGSGESVGTLLVRDPRGTLAEVQAEWRLGRLWPTRGPSAPALANAPLRVQLETAERRLASLPAPLRPPGLFGRAQLTAALEGSLAAPRLSALLTGRRLRSSAESEAVDVDATLKYSARAGEVAASVKPAGGSRALATVEAAWQGDAQPALVSGTRGGLTAQARAKLDDCPLAALPWLSERQVGGHLSGDFELKDWGRAAQAHARLTSSSLTVGKLTVRQLDATAAAHDGRIELGATVAVDKGKAQGRLAAAMQWGDRPLPQLAREGTGHIETTAFDLGVLSPFTSEYISELGGLLDAQADLVVKPDAPTAVSGRAILRQGVVQAPGLGQRFSDIAARVDLTGNELRLESLEAHGTTGRVAAHGSARLDGFDLRSAQARVDIDRKEALPVTVEGASMGDAWGTVEAKYVSQAKERDLTIDVPVLHLVMPESAGQNLQSLDPPQDVRIGVRQADGRFTTLPVQPLESTSEKSESAPAGPPLRTQIRLGRDVTVERGRSAQVQLSGQLTIVSQARTEVDGRIEVRGGRLDVSGKIFEIERGVATFEGSDPGNPTITATARWDAPDYAVYAEYAGDLTTGRLKLHSEPPLSQNEIANLLMFGNPEGPAAGSANTAALAVSVAGSTAVQGLNRVLDDFTQLHVSARIDTTSGSARPELVFQVSPRVSARVTRAIGAPVAGESPDRTFLTLELRLKRAWALSAVFGDHGGSALDVIWRRRY